MATVQPTTAQSVTGSSSLSDAGSLNRSITSSRTIPTTRAPEGGSRILVFGDSHTAGVTGLMAMDERGCIHSPHSWPNRLREFLGLEQNDLIDASCWGADLAEGPGLPLSDQVRHAESLGGIGTRTSDIFIQIGFNEGWSNPGLPMSRTATTCMVSPLLGCSDQAVGSGLIGDPVAVTGEAFTARIKQMIEYLRYYAPLARIHLVGYPEIVPGWSADMCARVGEAYIFRPGTGNLVQTFRNLRSAQRSAADQLGLDFIDLHAVTAGHSSCSPDPWLTGYIDGRGNQGLVPWHNTEFGHRVVAEEMVRAIGR
nr:SGNH/GDSL hydrolase family protein [Corynebacterium meridianum]